ncbi:MAG: Tol-Pal system beta propeller repeat protein TolB [Elusimicrobia bacterium]|nr:Tol-Pal system beta propeller repeat protein TolB [Elusimicrobiota bacterium]
MLLASAPLFSSEIYLQIQRGEKVTLGLADFQTYDRSDQAQTILSELQEVTRSDILFSRLFNLTQDGVASGSGKVDFESWGKLGADLLLTSNLSFQEDREQSVQVIASVYEISTRQPIYQKSYRSKPDNVRRIAHQIVSDLIYRFTGDRGVSASRIVFSNTTGGPKELYVMDYDGMNLKKISAEKSLALLPRWSPDGKEIIYTSYRRGNPDTYLYSVERATSKVFSSRKGLNTAAAFSPDGNTVVLTLSHEGAPNLYLLDRDGNVVRRLTNGKFADTSAAFSPDGRKILFVSDRPGWPQIYRMDADGTNLERLTDSGYCDSPAWSPRGDKIAYSRGTDQGRHDIVLQDVTTGETVQITQDAGSNENPSFSPDGRFLLFSSNRNGRKELYVSTLDGMAQKKVSEIPGDSITPAWGP